MAEISKVALDRKRDGYDKELEWQRFLLDSYTGTGGYQGRVKQDRAGFWGLAASAYSTFSLLLTSRSTQDALDSYLDAFPREDALKFQRRVQVAHYLNYVKSTTEQKIGYVVRKPHKRNNVPAALEKWIESTKWDEGFRRRCLVTAVLGWFPMVIDMPRADPSAPSRAAQDELHPYTVLTLPCHLFDYQLDESGQFVWAKTCTVRSVKDTWDSESTQVSRYTLWTHTDVTVVECHGDAVGAPVTTPHSFGKVPIVSWRANVSVEDSIRAESMNSDIALEGRRLFNLVSELDEHIRMQVFALLVWPGNAPGGAEKGKASSQDGLIVDPQAKNMPQFLAPPASVAATLETRIEKSIVEIYRLAGVEYERPSGVQSSAQSKENEFEKTNALLVAFAQAMANSDRETLICVGRGLGCSEEELQKMECTAHESYADAALSDELEQAVEALTLSIGRQAKIELLQRLVQKLLPGLTTSTKRVIDSEIEGAVDQAQKDAEAATAALAEGSDGPPDGDDPPGEEDGDAEDEAA